MAVRCMEDIKAEAVKRLKALRVHENALREFKSEGMVNRSERFGILYWLDDEEQELVKEFEKEYDAMVYHVIHQLTDIGELYSLLYVSASDDEWKKDMQDLTSERALAYVINKSMPDCSEFGYIGVKPSIGGVVRTY